MNGFQIGDLVMVINCPCCPEKDELRGHITQIASIATGWICHVCGSINTESLVFRLPSSRSRAGFFVRPGWCLRKIPPLKELDGIHTGDKLVEPLKALAAKKHAEQDREKVLK